MNHRSWPSDRHGDQQSTVRALQRRNEEIVRQHQGTLEVESEGVAGKGATFRVWLPEATLDNCPLPATGIGE